MLNQIDIHKPLFLSDFVFFINLNSALLFFAIIALIVLIVYLSPIDLGVQMLWIYCSLFPSFLLIIIRFINSDSIKKISDGKKFLYLGDYILLFVLLILLILPLIIQIMIFRHDSKKEVKNVTEYKILEVKSVGISSIKIMEYFVVLILPFITIGDTLKDITTMLYVLTVLTIIFFRLNIYYFNLPIMFFYDINEVELSDNKMYYLISKNLEVTASKENRKIVIISHKLKIARLIN